jgi:hypothetical protein
MRQDGTWRLSGPDENVRGARGAVQDIPLPQRSLALVDDRDAFSVKYKEVLLVGLGVVAAARLAGLHDPHIDPGIRPVRVPRLKLNDARP